MNIQKTSIVSSGYCCVICGQSEKLLRCARCKLVYYCSKEHQVFDWKHHKTACKKLPVKSMEVSGKAFEQTYDANGYHHNRQHIGHSTGIQLPASSSGDSQNHFILANGTAGLGETSRLAFNNNVEGITSTENALQCSVTNSTIPMAPQTGEHVQSEMRYFPEATLSNLTDSFEQDNNKDELCRSIVRDLDKFGFCAIDNFLGDDVGKQVLAEVLRIKDRGALQDGQLVSTNGKDLKTIRSDIICWVDGKKSDCKYIGILMENVDTLIKRANRMDNNGTFGKYNIKERTEAMVACYPGSGAHYVRHVDNPNGDGRCITAIYYLNLNWEVNKSGGLLRIFPKHCQLEKKVADVAPVFDRLLLFWSDRRNPHEVQPAFDTRYAITLWYFDSTERQEARNRGLAPQRVTYNHQQSAHTT